MTFSSGVGLRTEHYQDFLAKRQAVDWLEVISDNYMVEGGKPLAMLDKIRADYPVVMHGVAMSIGSIGGPDPQYLKNLNILAQRIEPLWISDHLCWTGVHNVNLHDLMPLPFNQETLNVVSNNIHCVQDILKRPLMIENVSSYVEFLDSDMSEWEFLDQLVKHTGCKLLLDVNNVYVSAINHGFDPKLFLKGLPGQAIEQLHLAGHTNNGDHLIDTHDQAVCSAVWDLYAQALEQFGPKPTLIERDDNIPELAVLLDELHTAKSIATQYTDKTPKDCWHETAHAAN